MLAWKGHRRTYCNSISVSEHVVMMILALVRNCIPSYQWVVQGGWNIADCVARSYDVEGMHVGTVAAGRIGLAVLRRLKPFDMHLHYYDRRRLPEAVERELNVTWHPNVEDMVKVSDVVTINCPLHPETEHLFNDTMISKMKRGAGRFQGFQLHKSFTKKTSTIFSPICRSVSESIIARSSMRPPNQASPRPAVHASRQ
jgi:phosphoglycerate dehydrogenase-like enzyme